MEYKTLAGVSNDSVIKATGKSWEEWMFFLDDISARKLSHKEIVNILAKEISNAWWCQKITNAYEVKTGKRKEGQTTNSGFQIGVTKTVDINKDQLWDIISSEKGMSIWLGITKMGNNQYETKEGIHGDITVFKPGSHFRMSWQPKNWKNKSILQVRAIPKRDKSVLSFHQEGLPTAKERENMRKYWKDKVEALMELIGKGD